MKLKNILTSTALFLAASTTFSTPTFSYKCQFPFLNLSIKTINIPLTFIGTQTKYNEGTLKAELDPSFDITQLDENTQKELNLFLQAEGGYSLKIDKLYIGYMDKDDVYMPQMLTGKIIEDEEGTTIITFNDKDQPRFSPASKN